MEEKANDQPLVRVRGLTRSYTTGSWPSRRRIRALDDVSIDIRRAEVLAVVGESGSGKTTLARCLTRLLLPDSGTVEIDGADLLALRSAELSRFRRSIQLVFQDAASAMNPSFTVEQIIEEPLRIQGWRDRSEIAGRAAESRDVVGVPASWNRRTPDMLSGGQRQRVALARALVLQPQVLVLDEVLRGLDLIAAAQIIEVLRGLRDARSTTFVFITHDLSAVRGFAARVAVMHQGRIVEEGTAEDVLVRPQAAYTRALLESQLMFRGRAAGMSR